MNKLMLLAVVLGAGCAVDQMPSEKDGVTATALTLDELFPGRRVDQTRPIDVTDPQSGVKIHATFTIVDGPVDMSALCTLVAKLDVTDQCSLMCNPTGFIARSLEDGHTPSGCQSFSCDLQTQAVDVGVCY